MQKFKSYKYAICDIADKNYPENYILEKITANTYNYFKSKIKTPKNSKRKFEILAPSSHTKIGEFLYYKQTFEITESKKIVLFRAIGSYSDIFYVLHDGCLNEF